MSEQKQVIFDATLLSSLMSCARKSQVRFVKNKSAMGGKSNSLETGSLAHFILEYFNKARIAGHDRIRAMEIGFAAGYEYIEGYSESNKYMKDANHVGLTNTPEISEGYMIGWQYVIETMEQYFEFWKNDSFTPIAAEEVKGIILFESDELRVLWKAKFDLIVDTPHGLMPQDYKTMRQNRDHVSLNNQFMGQCTITNSRHMLVEKIGFQKSLKPQDKFIRALIPYTADRLWEWRTEIVPYWAWQLVQYNETGYFPPNFTNCDGKYGTCEYKSYCETDRTLREEVLEREFVDTPIWDPKNDQ